MNSNLSRRKLLSDTGAIASAVAAPILLSPTAATAFTAPGETCLKIFQNYTFQTRGEKLSNFLGKKGLDMVVMRGCASQAGTTKSIWVNEYTNKKKTNEYVAFAYQSGTVETYQKVKDQWKNVYRSGMYRRSLVLGTPWALEPGEVQEQFVPLGMGKEFGGYLCARNRSTGAKRYVCYTLSKDGLKFIIRTMRVAANSSPGFRKAVLDRVNVFLGKIADVNRSTNALKMTQATIYAGAVWEFWRSLFDDNDNISVPSLKHIGIALGLVAFGTYIPPSFILQNTMTQIATLITTVESWIDVRA